MSSTVLFLIDRASGADRVAGARRFAAKRGWDVQVVERTGPRMDVKGVVDFWKPIGVVADCGGFFPDVSRKTVGRVPLVYMDEDPDGGKGKGLYVVADSPRIGDLAARELLSLDLDHYAFVPWRHPRYWSEARRDAFARAIRLHGRDCSVFFCPSADAGRRRKALVAWMRDLPKPCGIFAAHDPVAEEVLSVAAFLGLSVPEEIAVIGVDDDPRICDHSSPPLTSIRLDFDETGYVCAELLAEKIDNPSLDHVVRTYEPVCVVRRLSTRRLGKSDPRVTRALQHIRRNACVPNGADVDAVAAAMGLKRRMAENVFRAQTGRSIHDEVVAVRMEHVERLLSSPRQNIGAIAHLCGWASESVLRKAFKEHHDGLSMREWREKQK